MKRILLLFGLLIVTLLQEGQSRENRVIKAIKQYNKYECDQDENLNEMACVPTANKVVSICAYGGKCCTKSTNTNYHWCCEMDQHCMEMDGMCIDDNEKMHNQKHDFLICKDGGHYWLKSCALPYRLKNPPELECEEPDDDGGTGEGVVDIETVEIVN